MPLAEVAVNWTEIPGSKVKLMGVVLMAVELVTVRLFYSILQLWPIRCEHTCVLRSVLCTVFTTQGTRRTAINVVSSTRLKALCDMLGCSRYSV